MPGCPCGTEIREGQEIIQWLSDAALQAIIPGTDLDYWTPIVQWLLGQPVTLEQLCAEPPPDPPQPEASWWTNPFLYLQELLQLVNAVRWPIHCACSPCPPSNDCGEGESYTLSIASGTFTSGSCYRYDFWLTDADIYAQISGCGCGGHFTGNVHGSWNPPQNLLIANPNYDGTNDEFIGGCGGPDFWTADITGQGGGEEADCGTGASPGDITIWQSGGGGEPAPAWPQLPTSVQPFDPGPSCTEESQCESIDYLSRTVTELIWQTAIMASKTSDIQSDVAAINGPYEITIPGLSAPIAGTLAEVLPKLFLALAPPTADQLTLEWTEPVDTSGSIDVAGIAVIEVQYTTVPERFGYFGTEEMVYWNTNVAQAPARITLKTATGVYESRWLTASGVTVIPIPPLVVEVVADLAPGVEIAVAGLSRAV